MKGVLVMRRSRISILYLHHSIALLLVLSAWCVAVFRANAQEQATSPSTGWVVIPVDEYQQLRARALPGERPPEPPPVDATLTRADYELQINTGGSLATGHASLTIDVIKDGWVRVAIPSGLLVREARLDGNLVSLVPGSGGKGGQLSAVLSHSGRALLILDIALPVTASAGDESISLPSAPSGVTRASVQLPRQGVEVRLTGGLLAEKNESNSASKWLAYGRGNEPLTFTWRRKLDDHRVTQPLRLRGSLNELLALGDDSTSIYAEVSVEILQGAAKEVRLHVPADVTINQVSGALVADWQTSKAGELSVTFLEPVEQQARFVITGETHVPREGNIDVPILRLLNPERESGGVAVEVEGAGEIKDQRVQGLENTDASDLGEYIAGRQSPSLVAYRFRSGDANSARSLRVDVARYTQQAVLLANIEEARYRVLMSSEGKTLVQGRYAVRNNQRNFLKITLPQGASIWSASLNGRTVRPGQAPDGGVLLPLEKSRAGEDAPAFLVEIVYLGRDSAWADKGKTLLALPVLDLPVSRTGIVFYHSPLFKVTAEPGAFRVQPYEAPLSPAFNAATNTEYTAGGAPPGVLDALGLQHDKEAEARKALVDDFRAKSTGGKSARTLPVNVSFPVFGARLFLQSELTAENHAPEIEFSYQRDKKEGGK
jgi:hypothetical protein